jgi:hypothetical protein
MPGVDRVRSIYGVQASLELCWSSASPFLFRDPFDELVDRPGVRLGDVGLRPLVDLVVGEAVAAQAFPRLVRQGASALDRGHRIRHLFGDTGITRSFGDQLIHGSSLP